MSNLIGHFFRPEAVPSYAEVLERAADGFESGRYDWCQKVGTKLDGPVAAYCAVAAIDLAHEELSRQGVVSAQTFMLPVINAVKLCIHERPHSLPVWNDKPGRTKQEVIDAFKVAAKELRNLVTNE